MGDALIEAQHDPAEIITSSGLTSEPKNQARDESSLKKPPTCSVCIANYNGMALIDACLRSVLEQDCGFSVEIIVHDDASTDGSADHIAEHYPDVVLIRASENVGFCIANNRMVAAANGEYILLLNNDAELFPDALRFLLAEARHLGRPAILGLPQYDAETGKLLDRGSLLDPFLNPVPNLDANRSEVGLIMGACLWLTKALWNELGGFPEWFGSIGEDLFLCCRARLSGYSVRVLDRSGFRHRVGGSFGGGKVTRQQRLSTTFRRRALSERNKTFVMALIYPIPALLFLLPLHVTLLLLEGALLSLIRWNHRFLTTIYLPVIAALWKQQRRLSSLRQEIQLNRRNGTARVGSVFSPLPHKLVLLARHGLPEVK